MTTLLTNTLISCQKDVRNVMNKSFISRTLDEIFGVLAASRPDFGNVDIWTDLAARLSKMVEKDPAWGWRYVASVAAETVAPSKKFERAVQLLTASLDGTPVQFADTQQIQVYVRTGQVVPNSLILAGSRQCAHPGCLVNFVPVVPWQKYCPQHASLKHRNKRA